MEPLGRDGALPIMLPADIVFANVRFIGRIDNAFVIVPNVQLHIAAEHVSTDIPKITLNFLWLFIDILTYCMLQYHY